jgi:serine phosphatase RsbU (regulator of sigma subunit)
MGNIITVGVSKTQKYATRESGDTAEIIERPDGGLSVVLIDGQGSGRTAKTLSLLLSGRASALIRDGVRDGAVARALNDFLLSFRRGQVSATFDLISVDLAEQEIVLTRQGGPVAVVRHSSGVERVRTAPQPLGRYRFARPEIWQYPIETGVEVFVTSDGIAQAGVRHGLGKFDVAAFVEEQIPAGTPPTDAADRVLAEAIRRDRNRPGDDSTVVVLAIHPEEGGVAIRRAAASLPLLSFATHKER